MKFSIIIPIYNRSFFIDETLSSLLNQTYTDIEIICVDDYSTDNSLEKLETYALKDDRIKIVRHQKNLGPHCARKTGVENASGDYILFLDCDDMLEPDACKVLYRILNIQPCDVLEFAYKNDREFLYPVPFITIDNLFDSLVYFSNPRAGSVWNKAYKKELLHKAFSNMEDFYSIMGEDLYESVIVAYYTETYDFINNILLHYNTDTGISNKKNDFNGIKRVLESIKNTLNAFRIFFNLYAPEHKNAVLNIERQYVKYIFYYQILMHTDRSDWRKSLNLLPEYFTTDALLSYIKKIKQSMFGLRYELFKYQFNMKLRKWIPTRLKVIVKKLIGCF
ncbi:glycosyltransferase family 2 protein [Treponema denticola]|uniref:glycosyltransferase family 2 protein n=1 Tax=Treponema denticola TaxID=158 RepID=UPI0020A33DDA|nr:glycosyltransferase family 2 protein [Treponema denticola]UTC82378.1 glycosyltransferase family 2 protein [Treponema denticola]